MNAQWIGIGLMLSILAPVVVVALWAGPSWNAAAKRRVEEER